jgi:hypothetical protein
MNQQPDKLFRDKLENFQKPASAEAWKRIERNLGSKKNNIALYLKIAASVLLVVTAGVLFRPSTDTEQIAIQSTPIKKEVPLQNKPELKNEPDSNPRPETPQVEQTSPVVEQKTTPLVNKQIQPKEQVVQKVEEHSVAIEGQAPSEIIPEIQEEIQPAITEPVIAKNMTEEDNSVTIVLTSAEVNEKYLNKKALAEATSDEKKPSTLRKLLDKAYDLKHNQDPLGELRQKKNEILALNFKSDKQRSQNK